MWTNEIKELTFSSGDKKVALEVGDEVYVFEVYRPRLSTTSNSSIANTWYRGYVVATSSFPKLPTSLLNPSASDTLLAPAVGNANAVLNEEPQGPPPLCS